MTQHPSAAPRSPPSPSWPSPPLRRSRRTTRPRRPRSRPPTTAPSTSPATATVVSDYRFRGVSQSDRDPPVQGSVDITWHGFYVGAWASTIARYADTNVELDLYAGYAGTAGPVEYEIGAIAYLYPGGDGSGNIYEATGALVLHGSAR